MHRTVSASVLENSLYWPETFNLHKGEQLVTQQRGSPQLCSKEVILTVCILASPSNSVRGSHAGSQVSHTSLQQNHEGKALLCKVTCMPDRSA